MKRKRNYTGDRIGPYEVLGKAGLAPGGQQLYRCRCVHCKKVIVRQIYNTTRERQLKSCGCLSSRTTHGLIHLPEYSVWISMRHRCRNKDHPSYPYYGGRGITVCDRWNDFAVFIADVGRRPPGHSLERIDNDKGYFPGNVKWATSAEQNRNKSTNVLLTFNAKRKQYEIGLKNCTYLQALFGHVCARNCR